MVNASKSSKESRADKRKKRTKVKSYAESSVAEQAIMDTLVEAIDNEPENLSQIMTYGSEPMQRVGEIADQLIDIQKSWTNAASALDTPFDRVKKTMNEKVDISTLSDGVDLLKDTGEKGANWLLKSGSKIGDFFSGRAKKREDYEQLIASLNDTLPNLLADMNELTDDLRDSLEDLHNVNEQSGQMGAAWSKAVNELDIYINAGEEQLRRYKEEIVPDAQTDAEDGNFEAQSYLSEVLTAQSAMEEQVSQLTTQMGMSRQCAAQLHKIRQDITMQTQQINNFLTNAVDMWKGMIATASAASTSLSVSANIRIAGDFSSEIMDQSMSATEASSKLMIENQKRGVIDPAKVIENLERTNKLLTDAAVAQQDRSLRLETDRRDIQKAADKLSDTTRELNKGKLLDAPTTSSKSRTESASKGASGLDAKNDNKASGPSLLDAFSNADEDKSAQKDTPATEAKKTTPRAKKAPANKA